MVNLARNFGPAATSVRHEIYFTVWRRGRHQPRWRQALRALGGLGLTILDLYLRPGPRLARLPEGGVMAATLAGSNGWGALRPLLAQARASGLPVSALWHPRLGRRDRRGEVAVGWLPRPPLSAWGRGIRQAVPLLRRRGDGISAVAVAVTVLRGSLWQGAWERLHRQGSRPLVLHNDFDLMSGAALAAGWPALVVQHGVPTDEFFPCRAPVQIVWGDSSARQFAARMKPEQQLVQDGFGRRELVIPDRTDQPPAKIALISQGHTPVYGGELADRLRRLAVDLLAMGLPLEVWLHPEEGDGRGRYPGMPPGLLRAAPHPALTDPTRPLLVAGFASTALLTAAGAGHYVAGMDWSLPGSPAAQAIARPPVRVADAEALRGMWEALQQEPSARLDLHTALTVWRQDSFAPTGAGLTEWLRMGASCLPC